MQLKLNATKAQISDVRINLRRFVTSFFADLIMQAKGLDIETFTEFFEREVGRDGVVISSKLQNEFDGQLRTVTLDIQKMTVGFNSEVNQFNSVVNVLGKQGLDFVLKGNFINNANVLAARDGVVATAKAIGFDLGGMLKFKPWGAVNFAKGLNGALVFVGVAFELWDSWKQAKREEAFRIAVDEMVDNFELQRSELLDLINGPKFTEQFFPSYIQLNESVVDVFSSVAKHKEKRAHFNEWRKAGEAIEAEFQAV